ncbi:MAG: discoidin domain-containing protein [Phycisphaerales bacterium]|nr:MAG: discoidin domain-containing protein [Phycisphaerales bacterium]
MAKTQTCLLSFALLLSVLTAGTAVAAGPGLVAHYRLDEGSGTTAYDSSANRYDGTLLGQPQWVSGPGDAGVALAFHPNNACTGIECPTFDPTDGTGQFSFTIWAFWDGEETYHHFFTKSDGWGQATMMFQLELWGGSTSAPHFNRIGISYDPDSIPFYEMPKNEWTHLAFVYDGAEMVVYLNGVDSMGPKAATIGTDAVNARTVIGVADNDARVWTGMLDDVQIYSRPLAAEEIAKIMEGSVGLSSGPQPENEATDVPIDVTLGWTAGEYAATHDVYLGTSFDDVNDADRADPRGTLVSQGQSETTYDPEELLALGQTYYWRVDEVNAAPDYAIFKGDLWSFTTEPLSYPITGISATTNGISDEGSGPERTVDGSGLNADDQHSVEAGDMWLAQPGDGPVTIQYDLGRLYKLHEMWVWNYNSAFELILGFGLKEVTVEYSVDGADWVSLGDMELARATATSTYTANTVVDLAGVAARFVRLTVNSAWGTMGAQYGLSEVRFLYIPVQAREPHPADGQTEVDPGTVLSWRAGREAVSHQIRFATDSEVMLAGTAPVETTAESAFAPGGLDFGTTYYWKVDEAGGADGSDLWEGDIWSFTTREFATVDDFESYNDEDHRIYDTWIDGWVNETGSTVGYLEEPFAERTIVHGGRQSMPLEYSNAAAPYYSEAQRDMGTADWTVGGATALRLYVQGSATNDPDTLYVALEDAAGHVAVVTHPDPAVLTTDTWQEWTIPFDDFSGVNPAAIRTVYIGVGDRDNPTAGGAGLIFIDDLQFGRPIAN